jgi:Na+-transporting NADH:ubiquinone oxidoreductase subunit NqrD
MASVPQEVVARPFSTVSRRNGLLDKYFYFFMSLLVAAIVVWGFSHSVNANLFHPAVPRPFLLWIHGAVFSGWVVFYILQSTLVRTHKVRVHRSLGWFGVALGAVMVPLGITTAIVMGRFDTYTLHQRSADDFLIVPFYDMAAFAVCLALAIYWLLDAAFGRIDYVFNNSLYFLCLDAVILLGVARDLAVIRRVHKVYLIALPVLMVCQGFVVYTLRSGSHWWIRIADRILG